MIDTDQDVFDGKPVQTYSAIARKLLLEKFKGQVLPLGENDLVRFQARQAGEYTYPLNPIDVHTLEYEGKMRAAPELNNLLATAEYSHWAKDQKNHAVATLGFDYYKVKFIAGGHLFEGLVNIANSEKGRLFYDITKIKEIPASSGKYATLLAQSTSTFGNLNNNSILQQSQKNNQTGSFVTQMQQNSNGNTQQSQGSSFTELMRKHGYHEQAYRMERAVKRYGAIPRGEMAARDVVLPSQRNDDTHVRRFARTAAESSALSDEQAGEIGKAVAEGRFDYEPIPDEAARAHAESIMERGESAAQDAWSRIVNSTRPASKNDIAVGEYLLKQAAQAGDTQRVVDLAAQIAAEGTRAGQIVQAMRMLKKLQADLDRNKKNRVFLQVPTELRERLVKAKGEQQVGEVMDEIYQHIADQLPVRWSDKWNVWRYLSMLGNLRTHIRNVLSNTAFAPVVGVKNVVGTVLESAVQNTQRLAGKEGITRTKTISGNIPFTGGKTREFAIRDFAEVEDILKGGGKMNPSDIIREKQSVFKFKPLAYLQQMNFNLLEAEDAMFLKSHYVRTKETRHYNKALVSQTLDKMRRR